MDLQKAGLSQSKSLQRLVDSLTFDCSISGEEVPFILKELGGIEKRDLMERLSLVAASLASPLISKYFVGVCGEGGSGGLYLGFNEETKGEMTNLADTYHGEQSMVVNAYRHGESKILSLCVNASPCGHCRQFL